MEQDPETRKIITAAEHVMNMVNSEGWNIVNGKLTEKIMDLQNIHNIDTTDTNKMMVEILGRKLAVEILFSWLKNDVHGFVQQQMANNAPGRRPESEDIIDLGKE